MPRFTICVDVDEPDEVAVVEAWLNNWRDKVAYLSANRGCGCCVDLYEVEGSEVALSELPSSVLADSDWTRSAQGVRP